MYEKLDNLIQKVVLVFQQKVLSEITLEGYSKRDHKLIWFLTSLFTGPYDKAIDSVLLTETAANLDRLLWDPDLTWNWTRKACEKVEGGLPYGTGCDTIHYVPDVFFFSCLLFIGTFALAMALTKFRTTNFFPNKASVYWMRAELRISRMSMTRKKNANCLNPKF